MELITHLFLFRRLSFFKGFFRTIFVVAGCAFIKVVKGYGEK